MTMTTTTTTKIATTMTTNMAMTSSEDQVHVHRYRALHVLLHSQCVRPYALIIKSKQTNVVVEEQQFLGILAQQVAAPVSIQLSCCTK